MRTLTSLAAFGWLATGTPAQTPPSALRPLPTSNELPPPVTPRNVPQTLFFQKDAVPQTVAAAPAAATNTQPRPAPVTRAATPPAPARPTPTATVAPQAKPARLVQPAARSPQPTAPAKPPIIQTRFHQNPDPSDSTFKLPPSVEHAIDRASKPGEAGLPTNEELFALRSEADIQRAVVEEAGSKGFYGFFPSMLPADQGGYTPLSKTPFPGRQWDPHTLRVEPNFVCHHRLYFEELNTERYGWDLGPIQPIVSTGYFFKDLLLLPYHFGTRPCQRYEDSAGYCLPGDSVPYLLYPFEISVTGGLLEAGFIIGGYALLP